MREQYNIYGVMCIIMASIYTACFYQSGAGISVVVFSIGMAIFFSVWLKKLGIKKKKEAWFYLDASILISISVFLSDDIRILILSKLAMLSLWVCFMLYQFHEDSNWGFFRHVQTLFLTIGKTITNLHLPLIDVLYNVKQGKNKKLRAIVLGLLIAIPFVVVILFLLAGADVIFAKLLTFNASTGLALRTIRNILISTVVAYFILYAFMNTAMSDAIEPEYREKNKYDPLIGITFTSIIGTIYCIFSTIQILGLFMGKLDVPAGYSYAQYAREGFFQLLFVTSINVILVLVCTGIFENSKLLKAILTIISGCTYIMVASSAFRMIMYIKEYQLTFLRIFVLWALLVVIMLTTGVLINIYNKSFQFFRYTLSVVTILYCIFSFCKPDYLIANNNLKDIITCAEETGKPVGYYGDLDYIIRLNADAAPAIYKYVNKGVLKTKEEDGTKTLIWNYFDKIKKENDANDFRSFNVSRFLGSQYIERIILEE